MGEERRASLQNVISGEISYFANMGEMFAFLSLQVHGQVEAPVIAAGGRNEKQAQTNERQGRMER